jgi:hypothetical protein
MANPIGLGPTVVSKYRWDRFRRAIEAAFDAWDDWSGGQGDVEEQDAYAATVAKEKAFVLKLIDELYQSK